MTTEELGGTLSAEEGHMMRLKASSTLDLLLRGFFVFFFLYQAAVSKAKNEP